MEYHQPVTKPIAGSPAEKAIPGTDVQLVGDEVVVRSWPVTRPRTLGHAEGNLHLTDARIIFSGTMRSLLGGAKLVQEVHVQDVNGINSAVQRGPGVMGAAFVCGWALITLLSLFGMCASIAVNQGGVGFLAFFVSAAILALAVWYVLNVGTFGINVHIRGSHTAIGFILSTPGGGPAGFLRGLVAPFAVFLAWLGIISPLELLFTGPTSQVEHVMAELGAEVLRVQSQGRLTDPL